MAISAERTREIIDALRQGTVPQRSLDAFAVGLKRFESALDAELDKVAGGRAQFKAVRGDYGSGKTFFSRWLQERAKSRGFAVSEVQISEAETPLHRLETVYRRSMERLGTSDVPSGALRSVVDGWFFALEEDVLEGGAVADADDAALVAATNELMEKRLADVTRAAPMLGAALRGYREALLRGDTGIAEGLLGWLSGQPNVGREAKAAAGLKGDVDHFGALSFLQGLLVMLRDSGQAGLVLVLDEVETLQRVRGDVRDKGLNALRQLMDEIDAGRFPGLYLLVTGTPAFFDGPQGVQRLAPLAQRLHTDFTTDARFDNPRATQIRLPGFDEDLLVEVGCRIRDLFASVATASERVRNVVDDAYVATLARALTGDFGGAVKLVPRIFLKKLVADVLDRVELFPEFDPRKDYRLTLDDRELTEAERAARRPAQSPDDVDLS